MCARMVSAGEPNSENVNAALQERVAELIQNAIGPYRIPIDTTKTNKSDTYEARVEASFREACRLMPNRLDLRFGLASAFILQAAQTNSPQLDIKVQEALQVYQDIEALDTNDFRAPILYAAYTRAIGETNASNQAILRLMNLHPERTREYLEKFGRLDEILRTLPNAEPQRTAPQGTNHAIVILGAALETNGTVKAKLVGRLEQGLKLAKLYPKAPLILTGGNQKNGVTEAYAMSIWFLKKGISRERIHLEDQARDTVGNAVFASTILKKLGITHVTVVTSANHIRRGLADLEEACLQRGMKLKYATLAAMGEPDLDEKQERVGVYRDLMRASGFWSYPGILR